MSHIKRLYFSPATLTSCLVNAGLLDGSLLSIILLSSAEFLISVNEIWNSFNSRDAGWIWLTASISRNSLNDVEPGPCNLAYWATSHSILKQTASTCHSPYHSCRNDRIPPESTGIHRNETGIRRNANQFHRNATGIHWNRYELPYLGAPLT